MKKPTANALLEAVMAAIPAEAHRPGPEWMTARELIEQARANGATVSDTTMKRRLRRLQAQGKAECQEGAGAHGGLIHFWRLTNGHRHSG